MIPITGGGRHFKHGLIPLGYGGSREKLAEGLASLPRQQLKFFRSPRPVLSQQSRQGAVGEQLSSGLALGAVIGFVCGKTDALNFCLAPREWLLIAAMHRHLRAKRRDFFREFLARLSTQAVGPLDEAVAHPPIEGRDLFGFQL